MSDQPPTPPPEVIPHIPVTFQICINCHPFEYHLFEMDYDEMPSVWPGMLLMNIPGVPNVVGPAAEFDNRIVRLAYDGATKRIKAQIGGMRLPTDTIEEVKTKELPEWRYVRQLVDNVQDKDLFGS